MSRNCPSYKTLFNEARGEIRELKRQLRQKTSVHQRVVEPEPKQEWPIEDMEEDILKRAPFLELEDRAILIVRL